MTTYVVIPWDLQCTRADENRFPELRTLEEAADKVAGPADTIVAFENGRARQLSGSEKNQLENLMGVNKIGRLGVRGDAGMGPSTGFAHTCADYPPQARMPGSSINMECPACNWNRLTFHGGTK
jgi:hypothetical protein